MPHNALHVKYIVVSFKGLMPKVFYFHVTQLQAPGLPNRPCAHCTTLLHHNTYIPPSSVMKKAPSELGVLDLPDWSEKEGGNVDEPKQEAKPRAKVPCKDFLKGRCDRGKRCKFAHDM